MNIVETLKNSMPLMTAKQQHIAGFMVNNPSEMCYISLKDFSSQVGCTEATAIRFCQKLGYASFTDAKNAFRSIQAAKQRNVSPYQELTAQPEHPSQSMRIS